MYKQNEIIINGIEMRNAEYKNISRHIKYSPNNLIELDRIYFNDIFSRCDIYQSVEFNELVKIFEAFGFIKNQTAKNFADDFITACLALQPIPKHCAIALELRNEIICQKIVSTVGSHNIELLEGIELISKISKRVFESYCDRFKDALDVHMAFYAERLYH